MRTRIHQSPHRLWKLFGILIAVCTLLANEGKSAEFELANGSSGVDTTWKVTSPLSGIPDYGFAYVTLSIRNSGIRPIEVGYSFRSDTETYGQVSEITLGGGKLEVPERRSATASVWLWRGHRQLSGNGSTVRVEISTTKGVSVSGLPGMSHKYQQTRACFSKTLDPKLSARTASVRLVYKNAFDPESLPADWRALSGTASIVIDPSDWDKFSPAVRDAIRTWLGLGGQMAVFGETQMEAQEIVDRVLPDDSLTRFFATTSPVYAVYPGVDLLGRLEFESQISYLPAPSPTFSDDQVDTLRTHGSSGSASSVNDGYYHFLGYPVRDAFGERQLPFAFLCVLLFAFAVVVGPVNLLLWAPAGKRHRLFFTTPIISLTASGALLLVMFFQDGMSVEGRSFTILDLSLPDAAQPNAIVYQEQFTRSGMIGSSGFPVEEGLVLKRADMYQQDSLSVVDNQAKGKWFSSRRDLSLGLSGAVPLRWHVSFVSKTEDAMRLRLEFPVTEFDSAWFFEENGQLWSWDNNPISADGVMTLIPSEFAPYRMFDPIKRKGSEMVEDILADQLSNSNQRSRFYGITSKGEAGVRPTNPKIKWLEPHLVITSKVVVPE